MTNKPVTTLLAALMLAVFSLTAHAQQPKPRKFGTVSMADLKMEAYPEDSAAKAVYLVLSGKTEFILGSNTTENTRHYLIKILDPEAFDLADQVLRTKGNGLRQFQAATHNLENGKVVTTPLKKKAVVRTRLQDDVFEYAWEHLNVKKGSIIEVRYTTLSTDINYSLLHGFGFRVQRSNPVRYATYQVKAPGIFRFKLAHQGYFFPASDNDYSVHGEINRMWTYKYLPGFKQEPHMATLFDYFQRIRIEIEGIDYPSSGYKELIGGWDDIADIYRKQDDVTKLYSRMRVGFLQDAANRIAAQYTDPVDRLAAAHKYVTQTVIWDGEDGIYPETTIRKAFDEGKGDSPSINHMLIAMLQSMDMVAHPMLTCTRDYGIINPTIALVKDLNYVLAHVVIEGKTYLVDATDPSLPPGMLPPRCLSERGLVVTPDTEFWYDMAAQDKYVQMIQADLALDAEGELQGSANLKFGGYCAANMREALTEDGEDGYMEELKKATGLAILDKAPSLENANNPRETLLDKYENIAIDPEPHVSVAGDRIYVQACLKRFSENPFKNPKRRYPIDFAYSRDQTFMLNLTLPEGYEVESLPKPAALALPGKGGSFRYSVAQNGNMVTVMYRFSIKKTQYQAREYPYLQEFYNQVIAKQNESLVLKKADTTASSEN